ncbi:MAG: hypothetical protein U0667_16435 [Chloroflexota bacterium]
MSGHGYLLGDEGAFDGREGPGGSSFGRPMAAARPRRWWPPPPRARGLADLGIRVHSVPRPVNDIAHFAPDVLGAADAGDVVAERIAQDAAWTSWSCSWRQAGGGALGRPTRAWWSRWRSGVLLAEGRPLRRRLEAQLAERAMGAAVQHG